MNRIVFVLILFFSITSSIRAQKNDVPLNYQIPYFTWGKGFGVISPDSSFSLNLRFRMQNRAGITTNSGSDLSVSDVEARVRRLRLRFDGYLYNPRFTYVLQLSFSRGDIDFEDSGFPNIIRDAMVIYNFNSHFALGMGQTKLPGNRQRVISSGDLQMPDRSIVNSTFNVDRDFGIQSYYRNHVSNFHYVLRGSISNGEGRNFNTAQRGLAFTGRIELLPLGQFTNNGDYFEGDLSREKKPKISLGVSYSNNENARRAGGQLGKFLYQPRDIETLMADFLFKFKGLAWSTEFLDRHIDDPITYDPDDPTTQQHAYSGYGINNQVSYLFKNNFEIVNRYSQVTPRQPIRNLEAQVGQYSMGVNKYLRGHRVKFQTELTYETREWLNKTKPNTDSWIVRFQIEAGI